MPAGPVSALGSQGNGERPRRQLARASRAWIGFAIATTCSPRSFVLAVEAGRGRLEVWACGSAIRVSRKKSKSWRQALAQARNSLPAAQNHQPRQRSRQSAVPLPDSPPDYLGPIGNSQAHDVQQHGSAGSGARHSQQGRICPALWWTVWCPSSADLKHRRRCARHCRSGGVDTSDGRTKWPVSPIFGKVPNAFASRGFTAWTHARVIFRVGEPTCLMGCFNHPAR